MAMKKILRPVFAWHHSYVTRGLICYYMTMELNDSRSRGTGNQIRLVGGGGRGWGKGLPTQKIGNEIGW